jgi:uncharacterized integral membrane protein
MAEERTSPPAEKRDTPWTLIVVGVLTLYAILVVILNDEEVEVDFLFVTATTPKLVLMLLCLGIGFVAGFLVDRWRQRRKARASA